MAASGCRMVRYADDFVILCRSEAEADPCLLWVQGQTVGRGLRLDLAQGGHGGDSRQPGQGFEFLGYRFEAGRRLVRKKSLTALKDKVRSMTGRSRGDSLERIINDLNPMLRGWFGYFQHATLALFGVLDGFIRSIRAILRKQEKRPGMEWTQADHQRWPNAFFATHGLFTLRLAYGKRDTPDEETSDWKAVCGRTARRFEGRKGPCPSRPLSNWTVSQDFRTGSVARKVRRIYWLHQPRIFLRSHSAARWASDQASSSEKEELAKSGRCRRQKRRTISRILDPKPSA
jgi:hypothetical protein